VTTEAAPIAPVVPEADAAGPALRQIIWISGLAEGEVDQSTETFAQRLALELGCQSKTAGKQFVVEDHTRTESYGKDLETTVATICQTEGEQKHPVLEIYGLQTEAALISGYANRSIAFKAVLLGWVLWLFRWQALARPIRRRRRRRKARKEARSSVVPKQNGEVSAAVDSASSTRYGSERKQAWSSTPIKSLRAAIARWNRRRKRGPISPKERVQLLVGQFVIAVLLAYFVVLLYTALKLFWPGLPFPQKAVGGILVALTAVGLWKSDMVSRLSTAATHYICSILYLQYGEQRELLRGRLLSLLDHVQRKPTQQTSGVYVVAYSFGSIVALDSLFPIDEPPNGRFRQVETLVTIGCPFDAVRTYWPSYFTDRYTLPGVPKRWINVYSPIDVLGSNFREDSKPDVAVRTIEVAKDQTKPQLPENVAYRREPGGQDVSVSQVILLMGLRAHSTYWSKEAEEISAFAPLVEVMFAHDRLLT
jgi:hypothetical protein